MPWMPSEGHESVTHVILERMPFGSNLGKSFRWCQWWKVFHRQGLVKMMSGKQIGMKQLKSWWILMVPIGLEKSPMLTFRSKILSLGAFVSWRIMLQVKELTKDHRPDNEDEVISEGVLMLPAIGNLWTFASFGEKDYGSPNIIWNNIHSYIGIKLSYIHVLYM